MAGLASAAVLAPGFRLLTFGRIDSTNAEGLRRLAAGSARHFDVIVAESQSAGRGRRGRSWISPEGNLYLSLVVAPPPDAVAGQLAFVAALAIGETVTVLMPPAAQVRYKWPNDLLLDGRKLAGVLIEGSGDGRGFVIGIGVNVAAVPAGTEFQATALSCAGVDVPANALVAPLCSAFAEWYGRWQESGFAPLRAAWLQRAYGLGEGIAARLPDGTERRGVFRDLDRNGALVLETAGGSLRTIAAGDVFFAAA